MTDKARMNQNIFTAGGQPLFCRRNPAGISRQYSFSALTEATPVWTPSAQKCINLTAIQASAPLGVTITLSSSGGNSFLALRISEPAAAISHAFPSACRLRRGDAVFIRTADEARACNTFGAATAEQVAFNSRSDFTNAANAAGLPDGQLAALSSGLLIGTRGRIVLTYLMAPAALDQLQIESVRIKFYCRLSLTLAVGTSSMTLYWRPDTAADWIELQQASLSLIGTLNYLTTPLEQDITQEVLAAANPREVIGSLQTSFSGAHTGLGIGNSIQLDAVEVEVCATAINEITLFGFET